MNTFPALPESVAKRAVADLVEVGKRPQPTVAATTTNPLSADLQSIR